MISKRASLWSTFLGAVLLCLNACEFGMAPGGGGTGGEGLSGILVDGRGAPVVGARVRVYPASAALAKASAGLVAKADTTFTQADGSYRFPHLPSGVYNLEASIFSRDTAFSLFLSGIVFDKKLDLGVDTLEVSGNMMLRVQGEQGVPLEGARCELEGSSWSTVTDSAGVCLFTGIARGFHTVVVRHGGFQSAPVLIAIGDQDLNDGGVVYVGVEGGFAPPGWRRVSLRGYDFWVPPGLTLEWERPAPTTQAEMWVEDSIALYTGAGMRLDVGTGLMDGPVVPWGGAPEYRSGATVLDASKNPGTRLYVQGGPVSVTSADYRADAPYFLEAVVTNLGPAIDGIDILHFSAWASTRAEFETLKSVLGTIRKWKGAGPIPRNPPVTPRLTGPPHDTVMIWGPAQFSWEGFLDAPTDYYRMEISTDSLFDSLVFTDSMPVAADSTKPIQIDSAAGRMSRSISWTTGGRVYFWRMIAYGPGGSAVSEARRFTALGTPPAPVLDFPASNAIGVTRSPVLQWHPDYESYNLSEYRIEIASDPDFNSLLIQPVTTQLRFLDMSILLPAGTRVYWRVTTVGIAGATTRSMPQSFTTVAE